LTAVGDAYAPAAFMAGIGLPARGKIAGLGLAAKGHDNFKPKY